MDKQLFIACLKENFKYLDFWEENRTKALKAMVTLIQCARNEGRMFPAGRLLPYHQKPTDWPDNIAAADKALKSFSSALSKFGITFYHTDETIGLLGLNLLDPKNKDLTPEWAARLFVYREPAILQVLPGQAHPKEGSGFIVAEDLLENVEMTLKPSQRVLVVDLSRKKKDIKNDLKAFLKKSDDNRAHADELFNDSWADNYAQWRPDTCRDRAEAWDQLKVWRMRKERIPFSEIARAMGITQDAAKKTFYRAYELTQGRPYEPDRYRKDGQKINTWDLTKVCQTCPDKKKCNEIGELCPEIMRFADQDYVGSKEMI
jgi:hypothetical protein